MKYDWEKSRHFILLYTFLSNMDQNEFYTHTLDNGIRLIHKPVGSPVSHCGIIINTGSRDELDDQNGMAHFVEHLIFKGTKKRKAHLILSRLEDVGGEINAYTTKEETCVHASFFNNYYTRSFELMADIVFNSSFPEKEIVKEKEVIVDEINSYKDSPIDQIFDDFEEQIFGSNPIARNILGTEETLNRYNRNHLLDFYLNNYSTDEMVVASAGSLPYRKVLENFKRYFSGQEARKRKRERIRYDFSEYEKTRNRKENGTYQAHCLIGNQAYSMNDEKHLILHLLNNLLGGPGMNTRLNMSLREKKGLAYNVESNYTTYTDVGIFQIYFGTDKKNINRCIDITYAELKKLREQKLGTIQLARAKRQLIGQVAMAAENNENMMLNLGKSLLWFEKIESLEEIKEKIEKISSLELMEVSNEILAPDKLSYLIFY